MKTLFLVYILFLGNLNHPKDVAFVLAAPKCDFASAYDTKQFFEKDMNFEAYMVPVEVSKDTYFKHCFNSHYRSYEMTYYDHEFGLLMLPRFASRPCDTGTGYCKNK